MGHCHAAAFRLRLAVILRGSMAKDKPVYEYEPWGQYLLRLFKNIGLYAALCVVVGIFAVIYEQLDVNGHIPHDRTLDLYMSNDWLAGENRICWLTLQYDRNGEPTGQLDSLQCPVPQEKIEPHNVTVTFKGDLETKDFDGNKHTIADQWKCTRNSDGFTCVPMTYPIKN